MEPTPTLLKIWSHLPNILQRLYLRLFSAHFRVAVSAVITDEQGRVMLAYHTYRRTYPWGVPGGDLKQYENPAAAIERELLEETGLTIEALYPLQAISAREHPHIGIIYRCRVLQGEFRPSLEVSQIAYFPPHSLPQEMLPSERRLLLELLEYIQ